jgi:hypothetical protein
MCTYRGSLGQLGSILFVVQPGKPFQPWLMFASKAGACPFIRHLTRIGSGVICKHLRLASVKHYSLLGAFVNYDRKKFYSIGPMSQRKVQHLLLSLLFGQTTLLGQCYKTFYSPKFCLFQNKLERLSLGSLSGLV